MLAILPVVGRAAPYADCVIDARTGQILHETNSSARLHPASLTKMMTLYIAFQAIEHGELTLDTKVTVSRQAAAEPPSRLGLKPGQQIAMRYLIRAAAIKSANDAAAAIGDAIEGNRDAFAARMNRTAAAMGMSRTTFRNANGLTAKGHLSSACDMAVLGRRLFYDFPQYYNIFSRQSADAGLHQVASTNRRFLQNYEGADGIKTGYTVAAGFNLVASAQRGNERIIAAVFGGTSPTQRNARVAELLDYGFQKSPNRATVQPPPPISYAATAGGSGGAVRVADADDGPLSDESMALAVAGLVTTEAPPAGKTIRLNTAITESAMPPVRGTVEVAQADLTGDGAGAATAVDQVDATIAENAADMVSGTEDLLAGMDQSISDALQEAHGGAPAEDVAEEDGAVQLADGAAAATEAPVTMDLAASPEMLAGADGTGAEGTGAEGTAAGLLASVVPPVREGTDLGVDAVAGAVDGTPVASDVAPVALALADVGDAPAEGLAANHTAEGTLPDLPSILPPADGELAAAGSGLVTPIKPLDPDIAPAAPARPTIMLASPATSTQEPAPEELETVTRVSTSGGREWGVNVGSFRTTTGAEKKLIQVALFEMELLGETLRKVNQRNGTYEADFVGMTQADAQAACSRLTLRGNECTVMGPQGS